MAGQSAREYLLFSFVKVFRDWMTVQEVAAALGVSTRRVHQYVADDRLEAHKVGRDTFVLRSSVEALKRQPRRPGRPRKEK